MCYPKCSRRRIRRAAIAKGKSRADRTDSAAASDERASQARLRQIPSVEQLLQRPSLQAEAQRVGRRYLAARLREVLASLREEILQGHWNGSGDAGLDSMIEERVLRAVQEALAPSLRPVINATGVILHTNLGRAPLSREMLRCAAEVATQYSNLEYDLEKAARGKRDVHVARLLGDLLGAEAAIVVNNNAAAVILVLNELAEGGEVIVSRGELIEIGGSFRIPEIMRKSGALLREVGTTNRTRIADYRGAINERTRLLLRVHPSNFRILGFTERPSLDEIVALGREHHITVFEDLGSGCLVSLAEQGITDEAPAGESLAAGVDLISFSGDKLLGGPQAGVIAGKADLVRRIRANPLFRALRVDKLTYAILGATFQAYLQEQYDRIPALRMIRMNAEEVGRRAGALIEQIGQDHGPAGATLEMEVVPGESVVGGGSAPGNTIPTQLIALRHRQRSAAAMEKRLLEHHPPVIGRVEQDTVLIDLRTVFPEQEPVLASAIRSLAAW